MTDESVLFRIDERGVAYITLNRPEVHNAFDDAVIGALIDRLSELEDNAEVRALVLGSNGKHFSAGADLGWMKRMATLTEAENVADASQLGKLMFNLNRLSIPSLAVVQGAAYAGALGLLCCCDYAISSTRATFCVSEVKLGLSPAVISPYVVAVIGQRAARRYFLSAEVFDANEALRLNLVQDVLEEDALAATAESIVSNWLAMGPNALKKTKALIQRVAPSSIDEATITYTQQLIASIRVSEEGQEGLAAFFEKRSPKWQS